MPLQLDSTHPHLQLAPASLSLYQPLTSAHLPHCHFNHLPLRLFLPMPDPNSSPPAGDQAPPRPPPHRAFNPPPPSWESHTLRIYHLDQTPHTTCTVSPVSPMPAPRPSKLQFHTVSLQVRSLFSLPNPGRRPSPICDPPPALVLSVPLDPGLQSRQSTRPYPGPLAPARPGGASTRSRGLRPRAAAINAGAAPCPPPVPAPPARRHGTCPLLAAKSSPAPPPMPCGSLHGLPVRQSARGALTSAARAG